MRKLFCAACRPHGFSSCCCPAAICNAGNPPLPWSRASRLDLTKTAETHVTINVDDHPAGPRWHRTGTSGEAAAFPKGRAVHSEHRKHFSINGEANDIDSAGRSLNSEKTAGRPRADRGRVPQSGVRNRAQPDNPHGAGGGRGADYPTGDPGRLDARRRPRPRPRRRGRGLRLRVQQHPRPRTKTAPKRYGNKVDGRKQTTLQSAATTSPIGTATSSRSTSRAGVPAAELVLPAATKSSSATGAPPSSSAPTPGSTSAPVGTRAKPPRRNEPLRKLTR